MKDMMARERRKRRRRESSPHTCASSRVGEGLGSTVMVRKSSTRRTKDEDKAAIFGEEPAEHERQKKFSHAAVVGLS